jgi:HPt (histidine-containing phosphotransfer) domain-containing protein
MTIDTSALDEYREVLGDEFAPFFADLIETFFTTGPGFIQSMKDALTANDTELFTRSAHTLKSNSKTFGAFEFAEMAFELEQLGASKKLDGAAEKITALEGAYQQLIEELEQLRATLLE